MGALLLAIATSMSRIARTVSPPLMRRVMDGLRLKDRASRHLAMTGSSSLALFGGGSAVAGGGGLIAQVTGHVGTAALLGIYGSAALIAVVGGVTAIVKIVAERSPEVRKATALAKIAKKRSDKDGARILLLDRCLDKDGITANHVLKALNQIAVNEEQQGSAGGAVRPPKPDETGQNVVSIYKDEEGRASKLTDLARFCLDGLARRRHCRLVLKRRHHDTYFALAGAGSRS